VFALSIRLGAASVVSTAVWQAPPMLAQLAFTPLIATWAIWVGIAMSVRARNVRVAPQLATYAQRSSVRVDSELPCRRCQVRWLFAAG